MPRPFAKKKTFIDHATDFAESAIETLESAYDQAKEAAKEAGTNAKDAAGPALADARERAVPLLQEGRALAAEKASAGAAAAKVAAAAGAAAAAEQAAHGREVAAAKLAEVKGEPEPKSGGRLKKFVFFSALAALGALVYSKLRSSSAEDNWQSAYVPPRARAHAVADRRPGRPAQRPAAGPGDDRRPGRRRSR